ncbi:MAG: hypothetical protein PHU93_00350 [Candidatus Gracilibacteria bacterium]|nr:hypothetical protein [Candidatus Gracilibacteria bacterium]
MNQSQYRFWKYLPFGVALFLGILIPTIHAFESDKPPSRGIHQPSEVKEEDEQEKRGVLMPRKNVNQEERMLLKNFQKGENTGTSILNSSCIGPTYGSNNFTWALPPSPSTTKISAPSKSTMYKKPPRMRRENREEIERRPFWHFFK